MRAWLRPAAVGTPSAPPTPPRAQAGNATGASSFVLAAGTAALEGVPRATGPDLARRVVAYVTTGPAPWPVRLTPPAAIPPEVQEMLDLTEAYECEEDAIQALVTMQAVEAGPRLAELARTWSNARNLEREQHACAAGAALITLCRKGGQTCISTADLHSTLLQVVENTITDLPLIDLVEGALGGLFVTQSDAYTVQIACRKMSELHQSWIDRSCVQMFESQARRILRYYRLVSQHNPSPQALDLGREFFRRWKLPLNSPTSLVTKAEALYRLGGTEEAVQILDEVLDTPIHPRPGEDFFQAHVAAITLCGDFYPTIGRRLDKVFRLMDQGAVEYLAAGTKALYKTWGGLIAPYRIQLYKYLDPQRHRSDILPAIDALAATHDVGAAPRLKQLLQHKDGEVVAAAARALGLLGAAGETIPILRERLRDPAMTARWHLLDAMRGLGITEELVPDLIPFVTDPEGLELSEAALLCDILGCGEVAVSTLQEALRRYKDRAKGQRTGRILHALATIYATRREAEKRQKAASPETTTDLARIRLACRTAGRERSLAPTRGFDNRGRRVRRGVGRGGDTIETLVEVRAEEATGAIDWAATSRLDPERRARGMVIERRKNATGSQPHLIVIDPSIVAGATPRAVALLAGTVAERVLRRGDPVGLLLGPTYVPPRTGAPQLEHLMRAITEYAGPSAVGSLPRQLGHWALRRHLRPGTATTIIGDLVTMPPDTLGRLQDVFRARGADVQAIAVRRNFPMPTTTLHTGPAELQFDIAGHLALLAQIRRDHIPSVAAALRRIDAALVDLSAFGLEITALIPACALAALEAAERGDQHTPDVGVQFVGHSLPIRHETAEPADLHRRIAKAYGNANRWQTLLYDAVTQGWPSPLWYATRVLSDFGKAMKPKNSQSPIWEALEAALTWHLPASGAMGPPMALVASQLALVERDLRAQRRLAWLVPQLSFGGGPDRQATAARFAGHPPSDDDMPSTSPGRSEPVALTDSGVGTPIRKGRCWLRGAPTRGRGRYLRESLGTRCEGLAFHPNAALSTEALGEEGGRYVRVKVARRTPTDPARVQPVGGSAVAYDDRTLTLEVNDALVEHALLETTVAELQAYGAAAYGEVLWAELTAAPSWEELAEIGGDRIAAWRSLVARVQRLPLREALVEVQRAISTESGLAYRSYAGDHVAMALWQQLCEHAKEGKATLLDHLRLTLSMQGGRCVEFATIALVLLRRAGIPTALAGGWVADHRGRVRVDGHAWAEVMLPGGQGRWIGLPIEVSPPFTKGAGLADWLGVSRGRALVERLLSVASAPAALVMPKPSPTQSVPPRDVPVAASDSTPAQDPAAIAAPPPISRDYATTVLDHLMTLWTTGTPEQRGEIELALCALEIWSDRRTDRVWRDHPQTWGEYLGTALGSYIAFNARPHPLDPASDPHSVCIRTFRHAITRYAQSPIWGQWLTGVAQYFGC